MNGEKLIITGLILLGLFVVIVNAATRGAGRAYVKAVPTKVVNVQTPDDPKWVEVDSEAALDYDIAAVPDEPGMSFQWTLYEQANQIDYAKAMAKDPNQAVYQLSLWRTIGIWAAALFTLFIFSFLYKDNPFYKVAESVVVGVSAAYWMVVGWWDMIVPNLIGIIWPKLVQAWAIPGMSADRIATWWVYLVPLTLGVMLLWRLAPKGGWIARWPMAFIIGVFCGLRLITFIHADFLSQIRNSIVPVWVESGGGEFLFWDSLKNVILLFGVLTCLVYFFFSIEHKGFVGHTARIGIWFLMITFGAAFGYTVMGRIALLAIRLEFLFDDWLWLIDPTNKRLTDVAAMVGFL